MRLLFFRGKLINFTAPSAKFSINTSKSIAMSINRRDIFKMFCPATVHGFAEISLEVITENQTPGIAEFLELKMQMGFG